MPLCPPLEFESHSEPAGASLSRCPQSPEAGSPLGLGPQVTRKPLWAGVWLQPPLRGRVCTGCPCDTTVLCPHLGWRLGGEFPEEGCSRDSQLAFSSLKRAPLLLFPPPSVLPSAASFPPPPQTPNSLSSSLQGCPQPSRLALWASPRGPPVQDTQPGGRCLSGIGECGASLQKGAHGVSPSVPQV